MDDAVAHFSYDLKALRLEYKTTCDALAYWRGGDPAEQEFLVGKKQEVFRALAEASFRSWVVGRDPIEQEFKSQ